MPAEIKENNKATQLEIQQKTRKYKKNQSELNNIIIEFNSRLDTEECIRDLEQWKTSNQNNKILKKNSLKDLSETMSSVLTFCSQGAHEEKERQ